jgi:hypothetical protein
MTRRRRVHAPNKRQKASQNRKVPPLEPPRRADADQLSHEQSEIEGRPHGAAGACGCWCGRGGARGAFRPSHRDGQKDRCNRSPPEAQQA